VATGRVGVAAGPAKNQRAGDRPRHIAMAFAIGDTHMHAVVRGVLNYAEQQHASWMLTTCGEGVGLSIQSQNGWKGNGIVAVLTDDLEVRAAQQFQAQGIPVVTISGALADPGVPRVCVDNAAIGKLAAEHLLDRGYRRLGFYGLGRVSYSHRREQAFRARLARAGLHCSSLLSPSTFGMAHPWQDEMESVTAWVGRFQTPVGIFVVNDRRAQLVSMACEFRKLRVPQDVGLIGVDNNEVVCEFSRPPLSSVQCDWTLVGYQAAELLDKLMHGEPAPPEDILVAPLGVVTRASTDILVMQDERLARVIMYIQQHVGEYFGVERLIEVGKTSRRTLEFLFMKELGCTPYHYLCQQRVEKAQVLLRSPRSVSLSAVSRLCGFPEVRALRSVFRRMVGSTPGEFRKAEQEKQQGSEAARGGDAAVKRVRKSPRRVRQRGDQGRRGQ
jgi:LacI family transcriptional regulator